MVDRSAPSSDYESVPTISQLIADQMDVTGRSYRDLWRASGERVKHQTFQELRSAPPKSWPKNVETIRGMAEALDVSETAVVLAYARSLGVEVQAESMLAQQLPATTRQLGATERNAIVALIRAITTRGRDQDDQDEKQESGTEARGQEFGRTGGLPQDDAPPMNPVSELVTRRPVSRDDPDATPPMPPE